MSKTHPKPLSDRALLEQFYADPLWRQVFGIIARRQNCGFAPCAGASCRAFLDLSTRFEFGPLIYHIIKSTLKPPGHWPPAIIDLLKRQYFHAAAADYLAHRELLSVWASLQSDGIRPLLFKGPALGHLLYPAAFLRPSSDVDLLLRSADFERATQILNRLHFDLRPDLFFGFTSKQRLFFRRLSKSFTFRVELHREIANRPRLAVFEFADLDAEGIELCFRGGRFKTVGIPQALMLSCTHRTGHQATDRRMLWLYDIHLLAERLHPEDWRRVVHWARRRGVTKICHHHLSLVKQLFDTRIPDHAILDLSRASNGRREPSEVYLRDHRTRLSDLWIGWRDMKGVGKKIRFVFLWLFPPPEYLSKTIDRGTPSSLPKLYLIRILRALRKHLFNPS